MADPKKETTEERQLREVEEAQEAFEDVREDVNLLDD